MNGVAWAERPEHPRAKPPSSRVRVSRSVRRPLGGTGGPRRSPTVAAFVVIGSPLGARADRRAARARRGRRRRAAPGRDPDRRPAPAPSRARPTAGAASGGRWPRGWRWSRCCGRRRGWSCRACCSPPALASLAVGGGRALGRARRRAWRRSGRGCRSARSLASGGRAALGPRRGAALRGALLAAVLLAVFVPLLMSADAAFAEVLERVVPDLDMPVERALGARAVRRRRRRARVRGARAAARPSPRRAARRTLSRLEWALAARRARGAARRVRRAAARDAVRRRAPRARHRRADLRRVRALGLRAAARGRRAHARRGRRAPAAGRARARGCCSPRSACSRSSCSRPRSSGSGSTRTTFGFTRLRFAAHATLLWLGAIFVPRRWSPAPTRLPRAALAVTGATVLLFALADPDRRIAEHNLERYERTGKIDRAYLRRLERRRHAGLAAACGRRARRPRRLQPRPCPGTRARKRHR